LACAGSALCPLSLGSGKECFVLVFPLVGRRCAALFFPFKHLFAWCFFLIGLLLVEGSPVLCLDPQFRRTAQPPPSRCCSFLGCLIPCNNVYLRGCPSDTPLFMSSYYYTLVNLISLFPGLAPHLFTCLWSLSSHPLIPEFPSNPHHLVFLLWGAAIPPQVFLNRFPWWLACCPLPPPFLLLCSDFFCPPVSLNYFSLPLFETGLFFRVEAPKFSFFHCVVPTFVVQRFTQPFF